MFTLETRLKDRAHSLGFELVGIAPATAADGFDRLRDWLDRGYAGEMAYMNRHADARRHPSSILPEVRSVVMVAMSYKEEDRGQRSEDRGQRSEVRRKPSSVASYARGSDYHDVLCQRLKELLAWIQEEKRDCRGRVVVDTAPLLERDFARRAGLGWFGKNTMLIHKRLGSFFFLGGLLLDLDLQADDAFPSTHCGTCTACLDACPTQAFVAPGELDARRCISYLTIELRGAIPEVLRSPMGQWIFGCDVCQDVCPWNRKAPAGIEPLLQGRPELDALDPIELLGLSREDFRRRFRGTALMRPGRSGLLRNAAIVLGNCGDQRAVPALERATQDADPVVQEAAAWALRQIALRNPTAPER